MTKTRRAGKVLIDWSQNDRNKTTVCAYSLRARELPTVSTPVTWDEVAACTAPVVAGSPPRTCSPASRSTVTCWLLCSQQRQRLLDPPAAAQRVR